MIMKTMKKKHKIKVWPLEIRVFHWTLVFLITALFVTSLRDTWLRNHIYLGYLILGILMWRVYYGIRGSFYARFPNFVPSPKELIHHMLQLAKLKPPVTIGHPPPSGLAIVGFLVMFLVVTISGFPLFGGEERFSVFGMNVPNQVGDIFRFLHRWVAWGSLGLIAAHITGVMVDSFLHKTNLSKVIIIGSKEVDDELKAKYDSENETWTSSGWAFTTMGMFIAASVLIGYQNQTPVDLSPTWELSESGQLWQQECGDCHQVFHPTLLPKASWEKLMAGLENHFGEDATLDPEDSNIITTFLMQNASESSRLEPSYKIRSSIPEGEVPIAITQTPYWIMKHNGLEEDYKKDAVKSAANCLACHPDATSGRYEDHLIDVP